MWHLAIGSRAVFVFRNDEPASSWVAAYSGWLSTLPAIALAIFNRRWSAVWLITGGLTSLGALIAGGDWHAERGGELWNALLAHGVTVTMPMVGLGLGFLYLDRDRKRSRSSESRPGKRRRRMAAIVTLSGYTLLSLCAYFATDLPLIGKALETDWGWRILAPLLGPPAMLAMLRLPGLPLYLTGTVILFGLLWFAMAYPKWRRTGLLSALVAWLSPGLVLVAMVECGDAIRRLI